MKENGFKTIFCNRPDSEEINQPATEELKKIANELGLNFIHQPVTANAISQEDVNNFKIHYEKAEKPIFAFCRTGTRSTMLWSLSQTKERSTDEIIKITSEAGYDMSQLIK